MWQLQQITGFSLKVGATVDKHAIAGVVGIGIAMPGRSTGNRQNCAGKSHGGPSVTRRYQGACIPILTNAAATANELSFLWRRA